jgi:hypothetical protein
MALPTATHPGSDYYVNSITHTIQRQSNPLLAAALTASGWSGPYPWTQAKMVASSPSLPGIPLLPGSGGTGQGLNTGGGISTPNIGGLAAVGDFFNRLTQANTWLRVGEVVAGLLLVYIGLNATMRNTAVGNAVQSAKHGAEKTAMAIGAVTPK